MFITALLLDQAEAQKQKTGTSCVDSYLPFFGNLMKGELWLRTANIPAALLVSLIFRSFPIQFHLRASFWTIFVSGYWIIHVQPQQTYFK